jgi:hypothetical protein
VACQHDNVDRDACTVECSESWHLWRCLGGAPWLHCGGQAAVAPTLERRGPPCASVRVGASSRG